MYMCNCVGLALIVSIALVLVLGWVTCGGLSLAIPPWVPLIVGWTQAHRAMPTNVILTNKRRTHGQSNYTNTKLYAWGYIFQPSGEHLPKIFLRQIMI